MADQGDKTSPAPQLSSSPAPFGSEPRAGAGKTVVLYLHSPREKHWGRLLKMDAAGLWLRGIELNSFDAWARDLVGDEQAQMGLSTFFVPYLRVEKVVLDERTGAVPSLSERVEAIVGRPVSSVFDPAASPSNEG